MTVTKDTPHLCIFKLKIDEAVNYVPQMHAAEKLKAVQIWNLVSEKLQHIVNNCAADLNALTVKSQENESEKISSLEIRPLNALSNSSISSDFINLSSTYEMCSEITESYHTVDVSNAQLLTSEASLSIVRETSVKNNSPDSISFNHHLNSTADSERNICGNYITLESLTQSSCDNLGMESSVSSDSRTQESAVADDCGSKEIPHQKIDKVCLSSERTKAISSTTYQSNNLSLESSHELLISNQRNFKAPERRKDKNYSVLNIFPVNKKFRGESECDNVSDVSDNSVDSVKSDFETSFNSAESDTNPTEPIVSFVVSSTEEILAKNDLTPQLVDCPGYKDSVKSYNCCDCLATFATKGNLIVHMRRHTGEKPYSCAKCPASFTTKGNLKRHMKTHTGEKPYECTNCGGRFTEKRSLIVHMRRHTGERPYECKECGKRFAQSGILQTHMAMHLDLKFHLCEHCGKSFRQRSQLQTHRLRHSNERKYGCPSCSSRFLTKGDLSRHQRTHTGEKPYICQVCSKGYTRQQSLNEHLNRHYGIRPYSCKYCNKTFAEMSACYKHIKQHEKDGDDLKILVTESIEPLNLQDSNRVEVESNDSSCEIVKLPSCVTSKAEANELSEENDENVESHQTLISYIENYFHKDMME